MSQKNTQSTHRAAALGSSISHSLSPVSHTAGYEAAGLNGREYPRILRKAGDLTGDGEPNRFYETIPCKIAALNFPDEVTDRAREIGPTNNARA